MNKDILKRISELNVEVTEVKEQLEEFEGIANSINTTICLPYLGNKNLVAKALIDSEVVEGGTLGKGILYFDELESIVKIDLEAFYSYIASKNGSCKQE